MAEISINGRKKVSTLKREFKSEYGLTLDVKQGKSNQSADTHKTLAGVRDPESPGGKSFSIRANMKIGNLEKKFEEMGIKVNIKALEGKIFLEAIKKGEYQIANASWIGDFNDPVNFLELFQDKNSPLNKTLWENKTYQKHLKASQISRSSEERILEFKQAEEILMKEFPIIPLFFYTFSYRKSPQLSGVYLSPLGQLDFRWAKLTSQ